MSQQSIDSGLLMGANQHGSNNNFSDGNFSPEPNLDDLSMSMTKPE